MKGRKKTVTTLNKYFVAQEDYQHNYMAFSFEPTNKNWQLKKDKDGNVVSTDNPDVYMRDNPLTTPVMFIHTEGHLVAHITSRQETVVDNIQTSKIGE